MSLTPNEIRDRAANDLGLLRLGQSLQAQDDSRISQAYNETYAELKEEGLATWASTASVPDQYAPHVISLVAYNCLDTYAVSLERYNRVLLKAGANGELAKQNIRKLFNTNFETLKDDPVDF